MGHIIVTFLCLNITGFIEYSRLHRRTQPSPKDRPIQLFHMNTLRIANSHKTVKVLIK